MEKKKAFERLNRHEEAIVSYSRTIELDDPTSYALLRIGKCHEKANRFSSKFFSQTVHEDPLWIKDGLRLPILCTSKKLSESLILCQ
jgi:hypothetical protein